ncbi:DNA polymerase [Phaeocystis globosa virus 12T]|uniref:DNA polymerase n=1 Tax=Phaeocystis globosa virus PgV-16T TaxID=3071227 RepID=A0AC59EX74_9VIRU|nr:DNA polymerase [Phaeocystis globosa virus]AET73097.1 DNA polymerase [Phaeocystis globosa virus 12T]AET73919.1 DNA polymerase [Phaeocystis globosa virus 14T]AGM15559.1 DNA polymerase [Phaeocystis globosa virus PgV-16T]UYE94289.1 DNA polymerase [Phaeocystis globosa virus]
MKAKPTVKTKSYKLYDFNVYDGFSKAENLGKNGYDKFKDNKKFIIQMFGINVAGETVSLIVEDFNPFYYIKVGDDWGESDRAEFIAHIKNKLGAYYEDSIVASKLVKRHKLYGFDDNKLHTFIKISFTNTGAYNRAKKMFYVDSTVDGVFKRELIPDGYLYEETKCYLYEANIPPLLKLFHIQEISPSGWIQIQSDKITKMRQKSTHCAYEYITSYKHLKKADKDDIVKYSICSFDIEASSSHGDFPVPIKDYKKLATNILEYYNEMEDKTKFDVTCFKKLIDAGYGYERCPDIATVYPKLKNISKEQLDNIFSNFMLYIPAKDQSRKDYIKENEESDTDSDNDDEDDKKENDGADEAAAFHKRHKKVKKYHKTANLLQIIHDDKCENDTKLFELNKALTKFYPELEGDMVTFIGMTFLNYSEKKPHTRYIIVKGGCEVPEKYKSWVLENNVKIIEKTTEKGVLLEFTKIMTLENPHIVTGYNINGFDFDFMFKRSKEIGCVEDFLKLSKNIDEVCMTKDWKTGEMEIAKNKIVLASGEYNLSFINMPGRIIVDMCVVFRREYTLSSNKLDYVSSYFISDSVKKIDVDKENNQTRIYSKNLTGLTVGCYVKFDEVSHSTNNYKKGQKYEILDINLDTASFLIDSAEELDLKKYKINWGLAKDDVSVQEIFELANKSDIDRFTVGKYCIGDCDNVIWLLIKVDIITDKVEMSNLCDVPLNFLLQRGQGIKLQSYVSKKCGEKNTLMPIVEKNLNDGGYEGAHVFNPKTGLYLEDPVACVDYSSLYPSSMISENLSHDSKVWTKEYDLSDNLIHSTGEKDADENFIYDNLPNYTYVDVKYDTYEYLRKTPKAAEKKTVVGYKICRFAQFPKGKAIMPAILEDLLSARKATKKLMGKEEDPFKQNIYDKRQLSIKVTANSLYGQCGARTSAFYEKDVAASCTAIGRKLLFYGKDVIEGCYNNVEITLSDGVKVVTKAECVYGDTDSVFFKFNLKTPEGKRIINKQALIYTIELAKQAGELATKFLKKPHDLEYEKTFWPFNLLSKKRYDGMLYENDPEYCKLKSMGNVLKRRDNAPIVKDIYGGVVGILMKDKSLPKSIKFVKESVQNMIDEKYPIEKLLVTKALRGYYKNPKQIAHKVLADRIGVREQGNKPGAGDRMNYAYIKNPNKKALQGEKIETPEFIKDNELKLDYGHYITNQIMKPLLQLYALELENIQEFKDKQFNIKEYNTDKKVILWEEEIIKLKEKWPDPEKYVKKYEELRCKEVKALIFDKYLKGLK